MVAGSLRNVVEVLSFSQFFYLDFFYTMRCLLNQSTLTQRSVAGSADDLKIAQPYLSRSHVTHMTRLANLRRN